MKLIWQSPKLFANSGLFLKVGNSRFNLVWPAAVLAAAAVAWSCA